VHLTYIDHAVGVLKVAELDGAWWQLLLNIDLEVGGNMGYHLYLSLMI